MKRFKIGALLLSSCLTLGAFSGCSQASVPAAENGSAAKADMYETIKTVQVEGAASEISEVMDDGDADAELEAARQEYANTFVSAFAEQNISEIDILDLSAEELMDFVRIHLKMHSTDQISYEPRGEMLFETFTLASAHDVARNYFGLSISDAVVNNFSAPPEAHGDQPAGPYYEDNKIWYEAYDVDDFNRFAVVDSFTYNEDGTLTLGFTIYEAGPDAFLEPYYKLTPEEAAADSTLNIVTKGSAVVRVGQSGAYYLNSYKAE